MLDAPFVDMLKVMIVCNKARVTREDNKTVTVTFPPRDDPKQSRPTATVVRPTATAAAAAAARTHDYVVDLQLSRITSETGLHKRARTFSVSTPFYGEDDKLTISGNPSETALLRYCSRITPVSQCFIHIFTSWCLGWTQQKQTFWFKSFSYSL